MENGRHFSFLSGCAAQDVRATLILIGDSHDGGSRYIGDKHLATQHTNKLSHVLCSGQRVRSAALQLSRSTHESHRSRRRPRRASLSNLWPPCQVYSDRRVEQRPCGKEVSIHVAALLTVVKSHTDTGVEMLRVNIEELFQELTRHNSGEKFYRGSVCEGRQVQVVSVTDRCRLWVG